MINPMISSTEAVRSFGDYLARVRHTGETLIICKNSKPVATLSPAPGMEHGTLRDFFNTWVPGKDKDFADDLNRVNKSDKPLKNRWDS